MEAAALPAQVDLRPQCPAVYDQGQLGSCTGNGWAGAAEFLLLKQQSPDFTPSRLFIYYNERVLDNDVPTDAGASISDGAHVVSTQGCPNETLWPYDITKFTDAPPQSAYQDGLQHLALQVQQVSQDLTSMKEVLASGLPIVIGFTVFESFESDQVTATGIVPMPGHHEQQVGGHCVVLVGYDDSQSRFIVRNSWGAAWGIAGYCLMPYAYLTNSRLSSDFWMATGVSSGAVS
ncbi:MAG: C1 family peptidase [Rhodopila sp.]|nr:C1 family peptidase [Rhodopila sp.]